MIGPLSLVLSYNTNGIGGYVLTIYCKKYFNTIFRSVVSRPHFLVCYHHSSLHYLYFGIKICKAYI
jgi:hypothetical protein